MSINLWKIYFFENYFRAVYAYSKNITLNLWWKSCCTKKNLSNNLSTKSYCLKKKLTTKSIWKNTWPLIFDIMFNTWQIFDKNLQQRPILSHSGRLLPFQKWNLKPSHTKRKPLEGGRREAGGAENIMGSGEGRGVVADFYLIYLKLTNMSK